MAKWTVGSNQHEKIPGNKIATDREPSASLSDSGPTPANSTIHPSLVGTRNILLNALRALEPHSKAITLIGSHAVHERTSHLQDVDSTSTKDGDLAIRPEFMNDHPDLDSVMRGAGFAPLSDSRPGLWCTGRDENGNPVNEIDLLAPDALSGTAGKKRRSVDALKDAHGKMSVGRTAGIELATYDRDLLRLDSFDGTVEGADVYVAGTAALVCAKAYKLYERIEERESAKGKDRVLPKDASDLWRLVATSAGEDVRRVFDEYENHEVIGESVHKGRGMIESLIESDKVILIAEDALDNQVAPDRIRQDFSTWLEAFKGQ